MFCSNCFLMPTAAENKCCRNTHMVVAKLEEEFESHLCITEHERFIANCFNRHVLQTSFYQYLQKNGQLEKMRRFTRRIILQHLYCAKCIVNKCNLYSSHRDKEVFETDFIFMIILRVYKRTELCPPTTLLKYVMSVEEPFLKKLILHF